MRVITNIDNDILIPQITQKLGKGFQNPEGFQRVYRKLREKNEAVAIIEYAKYLSIIPNSGVGVLPKRAEIISVNDFLNIPTVKIKEASNNDKKTNTKSSGKKSSNKSKTTKRKRKTTKV